MRDRTRRATRTAAVATVASAALVLGTAVPAAAGSVKVNDNDGDVKSGLGIRKVTVAHAKRSVVARVKVRNLKRKTRGLVVIHIDSKPRHKGSDFGSALALRKHRRSLFYTTSGSGRPRQQLKCHVRHTPNFGKDRITLRIPRTCLKRPKKVRVRVGAQQRGKAVDYAPNRKAWTRKIKRG